MNMDLISKIRDALFFVAKGWKIQGRMVQGTAVPLCFYSVGYYK
jgi:hypothetical protein